MSVSDGATATAFPLAHSMFRVVMADTDAARVIYFGAPVLWAERLVSTWLADAGCATSAALADGFGLPAVRCEAQYESALRLDDPVQATLWLDRLSARSLTFRSEFTRVGESDPAVTVRVTQVQVASHGSALTAVPLLPKLVAALVNPTRQN